MRPNKCGGVSIWMIELDTARIAIPLAPTRINSSIDNGSERQKEKTIRENENA